jgi:Family of unknown function (DUF5762)
MTIPFWTNDPSILFNKDQIFELWPTSNMCYEQKLNAITRIIIVITILGYIFSRSARILVAGVSTIAIIVVLFKMRKPKLTKEMMNEGFRGNEVTGMFDKSLNTVIQEDFKEGNKKNPFGNVLLTEIMDDPDRKSAPPSFNPSIDEDITKNVKRSVQSMNPGIKNTNKQLYGDLWENFELDQSNRVFFSTANTRVTNDQGAFSKFLYGNMPSAKGSSTEDNLQREKDNYRYTLY